MSTFGRTFSKTVGEVRGCICGMMVERVEGEKKRGVEEMSRFACAIEGPGGRMRRIRRRDKEK